jgi:hypothetical protein
VGNIAHTEEKNKKPIFGMFFRVTSNPPASVEIKRIFHHTIFAHARTNVTK